MEQATCQTGGACGSRGHPGPCSHGYESPCSSIILRYDANSANPGRPAFDCRGSITIAFSKSNKSIGLTYEHTPIHRTVAELLSLLGPAHPPQAVTKTPNARKVSRTPKSKLQTAGVAQEQVEGEGEREGEGEGGGGDSRPLKRKSTTAPHVDGTGQPKQSKRRKKKDTEATQAEVPILAQPQASEVNMLPPEVPRALPVGESPHRSLYNTQPQPEAQNGAPSGKPASNYPEGLVGTSAPPTEPQPTTASPAARSAPPILALPAGEAERRRDVAIQLLNENGIDPQTLSEEQFSIFSNQSPDLQKESLAMLVRYGAERLRIVHPGKPAPPTGSLDAAAPAHEAGPSPANDSPLVATSAAIPAAGSSSSATPTQKPSKQRGPAGSCERCRYRKIKCTRERPSCAQCISSQNPCFYPPPRTKKGKSGQVEEAVGMQERTAS